MKNVGAKEEVNECYQESETDTNDDEHLMSFVPFTYFVPISATNYAIETVFAI